MRASNSGGFSGYTNIAGMTTAAPSAPSTPSNPTPGNGATNVSTKLNLAWACSNATSYEVWVGPNGALAYKGTVSGTSYAVSNLNPSTNYSWKIVAKNGTGLTATGPEWTFKTKAAVVRGKK